MTRRLQHTGGLRGSLRVPGDKSISHRALLLNALAPGRARIQGFLPSADCLSTMDCLRAYGVQFDYDPAAPTTVTLDSPGRHAFQEPAAVLDCGNSGTTMRLMAGLAAGRDLLTILDGDSSLRARPMARVLGPLAQMGARVDGRAQASLAPLVIRGGKLQPFRGELPVASAQVKSAITIAALDAAGPSSIQEAGLTRDHTENMLSAMGARIERRHPAGAHPQLQIEPAGELQPVDLTVPGDISSAAFWLVAGAILPDSEIQLRGVGCNPTRAGVIEILRAMGAQIEIEEERSVGGEPVADLVVRSASLHGTVIAGDLVVTALDELPVLAVAAAAAQGRTELREAQELRVKESDRIDTTVAMLRALGAQIEPRPDGFVIEGGRPLQGAELHSHGDHRLAMAAAVAALLAEGESVLRGEEDVVISYPQFWDHLRELTQAQAFA